MNLEKKPEESRYEDVDTLIDEQRAKDNETVAGICKVLETRGAKFLSNGGFDLEGSSEEIKKIVRENGPE